MKKWFLLLILAPAALLVAVGSQHNLFRVRQAKDLSGETHRLGESRDIKAIAFVFLGPECPVSQRYIPELNRIVTEYGTNAVQFFGVVAGKSMTHTQAVVFAREYAIHFPILFDDELALARWLRPTHMPEAFVLTAAGDMLYRGRIDDWYQSIGKPRARAQHHEFRDALTALRAGKTPAKSFAPPVGCYFEDWPAQPAR